MTYRGYKDEKGSMIKTGYQVGIWDRLNKRRIGSNYNEYGWNIVDEKKARFLLKKYNLLEND